MSRLSQLVLRAGLAASIATAALAPVAQAATPTVPPVAARPTIAAVLAPYASGFDTNNDNFNIATHLVLQFPDLVAAATRPGANTVFLPTDYAFRRLVKSLTGAVVVPEAQLFDAVMRLGTAMLRDIARYHVVSGLRLTYADVLRRSATVVVTLQGRPVRFLMPAFGRHFLYLQDEAPELPDAKVIQANIRASNGLIHAIDRVMLPFNP